MKYKAVFILILALSLLFVGCKQKPVEATVPPETTQPTQPPPPVAGLLLRQEDEQVQQALEELGFDVQVKLAENDQAKQNEQVKALLDGGCELLVVQPVMTTGLDVLVEQVKPTGVPLIILDHEPEQGVLDLYDKLAFLGPDHSQAAAVLTAAYGQLPVSGDLNFDGATWLVLICGPEDHLDSSQRLAEFTQSLPADTHVILETVAADWTQEGGRAATAQLLAKYGPDIEVLVTLDGNMALGALEAIDNSGRTPGRDLYLVTVGDGAAVWEQAEQGRISGLSAPDGDMRLQKLSELVAAMTAGEAVEKKNLVDYIDSVTILT